MRKIITLLSFVLVSFNIYSQTTAPYYAILNHGDKFYIKQVAGADLIREMSNSWRYSGNITENTFKTAIESIKSNNTDNAIIFDSRETVLILDSISENVYYAVDPIGRFIYIEGKINKVIYTTNTPGVCWVKKNIVLENGTNLPKGCFIWCVDINTEKQTAQIQIGRNEIVPVPLNKISILKGSVYANVPALDDFNNTKN